MARYSQNRIQTMLNQSDNAATSDAKGALFEDLVSYLFVKIPGITEYKRNVFGRGRANEVDIAFWNNKRPNGLYFLDGLLFTECKNTVDPIGSRDVGWFRQKIRDRGMKDGVLIATSGITGDEDDYAHGVIIGALQDGVKILIINRDEILSLSDSQELVTLLQEKFGKLVLSQNVD